MAQNAVSQPYYKRLVSLVFLEEVMDHPEFWLSNKHSRKNRGKKERGAQS